MRKVFYASDYACLDSDVICGGGTDVTEALQALLDQAPICGGVRLIMDGAALVTGLKVYSNTTIECLDKDCGFYLADHSNCAVLSNANRSFSDICDRNITLVGGTYNHNCLNQEHDVPCSEELDATFENLECEKGKHWVIALEFYGVENLSVSGVTVRDQRTFAFAVGNFRRVLIENTYIELENVLEFGNQDGFHFWGPGRFLTVRNVGGKTEDDFMNIGPDERDGVSSITDVLIDGVMLDGAWQGIRLLSRGSGLLDRVVIRGVTGTYRCFGFYINPWFIGESMGIFGSIVFEDIDLRALDNPLKDKYYGSAFLFSVGGDIRSLILRNIHWIDPYDDRRVFRIGYPFHDVTVGFENRKPRIESMLIDGFWVHKLADGPSGAEYVTVRGIIDKLEIKDVDIFFPGEKNKRDAYLLKTEADCEIKYLSVSNVYAENLCTLLELHDGSVDFLHINGIFTKNVLLLTEGNAGKIVASDVTEI